MTTPKCLGRMAWVAAGGGTHKKRAHEWLSVPRDLSPRVDPAASAIELVIVLSSPRLCRPCEPYLHRPYSPLPETCLRCETPQLHPLSADLTIELSLPPARPFGTKTNGTTFYRIPKLRLKR